MPDPSRRRRRLLAAGVVLAWAALGADPAWSAGGSWRWPLDGRVVGEFALTPREPFAAGQRRGIDLAARPGTAVRSACGGRVAFAGPVPRYGLGVSVRCGPLTATHLGLGALAVRAGERVLPGARLGPLGSAGRLRLGARVTARPRGYLDPLRLLASAERPSPPALPLGRAPRRGPPATPAPAPARVRAPFPPPRAAPAIPPLALAGLILLAAGLPLGGLVHRSRRRRAGVLEPVHEGS